MCSDTRMCLVHVPKSNYMRHFTTFECPVSCHHQHWLMRPWLILHKPTRISLSPSLNAGACACPWAAAWRRPCACRPCPCYLSLFRPCLGPLQFSTQTPMCGRPCRQAPHSPPWLHRTRWCGGARSPRTTLACRPAVDDKQQQVNHTAPTRTRTAALWPVTRCFLQCCCYAMALQQTAHLNSAYALVAYPMAAASAVTPHSSYGRPFLSVTCTCGARGCRGVAMHCGQDGSTAL